MDQRRKLSAVKARLGQPRIEARSKGEYVFQCCNPECDTWGTDKAKLSVNIERDWFNCWVCNFSGRNLAAIMVRNSPEWKEYIESRSSAKVAAVTNEKQRCHSLPVGFIPLDVGAPQSSVPYRAYLHRRGITDRTMGIYRMGYVDDGYLSGRVVVPSFDAHGMVNFWSARTIYDRTPTYVLPDCSKDIISNEHLIDWDSPVYLVEGIFDEIAVGAQGIALYGKYLPQSLTLKLIERRPPVTYVCLDVDARREAIKIMERLVGYDIKAALVDLPGKDPGQLGGHVVEETAQASRHVTGSLGLLATKGML